MTFIAAILTFLLLAICAAAGFLGFAWQFWILWAAARPFPGRSKGPPVLVAVFVILAFNAWLGATGHLPGYYAGCWALATGPIVAIFGNG